MGNSLLKERLTSEDETSVNNKICQPEIKEEHLQLAQENIDELVVNDSEVKNVDIDEEANSALNVGSLKSSHKFAILFYFISVVSTILVLLYANSQGQNKTYNYSTSYNAGDSEKHSTTTSNDNTTLNASSSAPKTTVQATQVGSIGENDNKTSNANTSIDISSLAPILTTQSSIQATHDVAPSNSSNSNINKSNLFSSQVRATQASSTELNLPGFKRYNFDFSLNNNKYLLTHDGELTKYNGSTPAIKKSILSSKDGSICEVYYFPGIRNIILVCSIDIGEGVVGTIKMLDPDTLSVIWENKSISAVENVIAEDNYVYITGCIVSKINIETGSTVWKSYPLYEKYPSFGQLKNPVLTSNDFILEVKGQESPYDKIATISFNKVSGQDKIEYPTYLQTTAQNIPYLNVIPLFIGETYDKVKKDIDDWVYGRKQIIRKLGAFPFGNKDPFLGFALLPTDQYYLISDGGIYVLRNSIFVANIKVCPMNTYVYDYFKDMDFKSMPLPHEEIIAKTKFKTFSNIVGEPTLSILSWKSDKALIRILSADFPSKPRSIEEFYKRSAIIVSTTLLEE